MNNNKSGSTRNLAITQADDDMPQAKARVPFSYIALNDLGKPSLAARLKP
jgi:hypothetical protein